MKKFTPMLQRLLREKRGNVFMMTGFAIIPLVGATGMGVDYARASRMDTKLSAAADAAALAAVSETNLLAMTDVQAEAYARNIFNQQAATIRDLIYDPADLVVSVTHTGIEKSNRSVSITFSAQSRNNFGSILGLNTLQIGGTVGSTIKKSPNMDFHLVLDTSPSMALPTTDAGATLMSTMVGCQFACHTNAAEDHGVRVYDNNTTNIVKSMNVDIGDGKRQIHPDGTYVKNGRVFRADNSYADSYWLALNKGITLRIDAERAAVVDLMSIAQAQAAVNGATYRAAVHTFDYKENFKTVATLSGSLNTVATNAQGVQLLKINKWSGSWGCPSPTPNPLFCNDFRETSFTGALEGANAAISNPGNGTNVVGDAPKKILFMVTDGISDEGIPSAGIWRTRTEMHSTHIDLCSAIKARGITIAILYTEYTPESITNDGQQGIDVTARLPFVAPQLTACASPNLMYTVRPNEDISTALTRLFNAATSRVRLVQ
jgi:Flp pilus assembly protein TadG